jgi:hypothetical protein
MLLFFGMGYLCFSSNPFLMSNMVEEQALDLKKERFLPKIHKKREAHAVWE